MKLDDFVKERDAALFSLDESRIRAYMRKYDVKLPAGVFWLSVYKALRELPHCPVTILKKAESLAHPVDGSRRK